VDAVVWLIFGGRDALAVWDEDDDDEYELDGDMYVACTDNTEDDVLFDGFAPAVTESV
jgi:hypothetical protein